jgi:hypothetical protein
MHSKFSTCIKVVGGALKVFTGKVFGVKNVLKIMVFCLFILDKNCILA